MRLERGKRGRMSLADVPGREDRRQIRYEVEGEVFLKVLFTKTADMKEVRARLRNVCAGGIYIETEETIPMGALADLELKLEGKPLANTLGLVRWFRPGEGVGIEFLY